VELTYINSSGESITLKQSRPYFLTKIDGTGNIRQTVNTFKAPDQDGAFYISSTLDMRNITLEGTVVADSLDEAYVRRQRFLKIFAPSKRDCFITIIDWSSSHCSWWARNCVSANRVR
jgi:hypothetical protein